MPTDHKNRALSEKQCQACRGGMEPLAGAALEVYREQIDPAWEIREEKTLERNFTFRNFQQALDFTNAVGRLAEDERHHPEITLTWGVRRCGCGPIRSAGCTKRLYSGRQN